MQWEVVWNTLCLGKVLWAFRCSSQDSLPYFLIRLTKPFWPFVDLGISCVLAMCLVLVTVLNERDHVICLYVQSKKFIQWTHLYGSKDYLEITWSFIQQCGTCAYKVRLDLIMLCLFFLRTFSLFSFNSTETTGILYTNIQEREFINIIWINLVVNNVIFLTVAFTMGAHFILKWGGGMWGEKFIKIEK